MRYAPPNSCRQTRQRESRLETPATNHNQPQPSHPGHTCRRDPSLARDPSVFGVRRGPLAVSARLFESADRAERTDLRHAEIADQFRPVIAPANALYMIHPKTRAYDGEAFLLSFEVPLYLNGRAALVEREFQRPGEVHWETLPATLNRVLDGRVEVRIPAPEGSAVRARGSLLPQEPLDRTSEETLILPGARLQGSIGLSALVPPDRSTSVRVRLTTENLRGWPGKTFSLPLIGIPILSAPTRDARPNFILVSLDTLRADAVSAYGAERRATPNLGSFAKDAVTFLDASTTYPSTTASHMSLFTGLYPEAHQILAPPSRLKPDVPTLPDLVAQAGYRTGAVTENGMLFANIGFVRGFDSYDEVTGTLSRDTPGWAAEVVDRGIAWLEKYPHEQFFLFLHTYQVHEPYIAPEGFDKFPIPEGIPFRRYLQDCKAEVLYTDHQMG